MANAAEPLAVFKESLYDAGCSTEQVQTCLQLAQSGEMEAMLVLLQKHRSSLLEHLHRRQREIDNLDFVLYSLRWDN